jgi:hypothetical protein
MSRARSPSAAIRGGLKSSGEQGRPGRRRRRRGEPAADRDIFWRRRRRQWRRSCLLDQPWVVVQAKPAAAKEQGWSAVWRSSSCPPCSVARAASSCVTPWWLVASWWSGGVALAVLAQPPHGANRRAPSSEVGIHPVGTSASNKSASPSQAAKLRRDARRGVGTAPSYARRHSPPSVPECETADPDQARRKGSGLPSERIPLYQDA